MSLEQCAERLSHGAGESRQGRASEWVRAVPAARGGGVRLPSVGGAEPAVGGDGLGSWEWAGRGGKSSGKASFRSRYAHKLLVPGSPGKSTAMSSGDGTPPATAALCSLYHEAGQQLQRLQDQLAARDALIASLRTRLAALEGDTAPSLVDALLDQVERFREQLRRREEGASETQLRQVRGGWAVAAAPEASGGTESCPVGRADLGARGCEAQGTLRGWGLKSESLEGPCSRGMSRTEVSRRLWGTGFW